MKKFILFSAIFGLFILNVNLASAGVVDCEMGDLFSRVTGKPCSTTSVISGTSTTSLGNTAGVIFTKDLSAKLKSRGSEVLALQRYLKNEGYLFGKVDGKFGKITGRAVGDFQEDNDMDRTEVVDAATRAILNRTGSITPSCIVEGESYGANDNNLRCCSGLVFKPTSSSGTVGMCVVSSGTPVISGVSGPQTLKVGQTGTWEVKASSPNGGNLSYSVLWGDEELGLQNLPPPSYPTKSTAQYAIFTHSYYYEGTFEVVFTVESGNTIRCITTPCPSNAGSAQTRLTVKVARETSTSKGYLEISPESLSLKVGESVKVKAIYQPPMPECPTGLGVACIQVMPQSYEVDATWTISNENVAKIQSISCLSLNCKARHMVQGVSAGTTELKATYILPNDGVLTKTAKVIVSNEDVGLLVPVTQGTFSFSKSAFNFNYTQGGALPTVQTLDFTNTSNVNINYTISVPNKPSWLNSSYNKEPMTAAPGQVTGLGAFGDPSSGLSPGNYTTNIILTGNFVGSPLSIPITLTVSPAPVSGLGASVLSAFLSLFQ